MKANKTCEVGSEEGNLEELSSTVSISRTLRLMSDFKTKSIGSIRSIPRVTPKTSKDKTHSKFTKGKKSRANTRANFYLPLPLVKDLEEGRIDSPCFRDFVRVKEEKRRKEHRMINAKLGLMKKKAISFDLPCFYGLKLSRVNKVEHRDFIERVEIFNFKTNSKFDQKVLKKECFPPGGEREGFKDYNVFRVVENAMLRYAFERYKKGYERRAELLHLIDSKVKT